VKSWRPWGLVALATIWICGCSRSSSNAGDQKAETIARGKEVYDVYCAQCHDAADLHLIKDQPKLDGLFAKPTLPSGAPATDAEVRETILHGRGIMPPFEQVVKGTDLDALLLYLHTR
jgi:mono/diheme cytochrome c family protein